MIPAATLLNLPPEVLLGIFIYLDLPDLAQLSSISPLFNNIASDPALNRLRIFKVAPSRIDHFLCAERRTLRPTVADLVQRGIMRGFGLERRWKNGLYLYSPQSVKLYWTTQRLDRVHISQILRSMLENRPSDPLKLARIVRPDLESSSSRISRVLLPTVHKLKWNFQRDRLAKKYRGMEAATSWVEANARWYPENERVRLAICPDVRKLKLFFEELGK